MQTINQQQREELTAAGYRIEDMQKEWGDGWWNGLHRWQHESGEFQETEPSSDPDEAWSHAWAHYQVTMK